MVEVNEFEVLIPPYGNLKVNENPGVLFDYSRKNNLLLGGQDNIRLVFPVGQAVPEEDSSSVDLMITPEDRSKFVTIENIDTSDLEVMFELGLAFLDFDSGENVTSLIGYNIGGLRDWKKSNQSWDNLHLKAIRFEKDFKRKERDRREVEDVFASRAEKLLKGRYESSIDGVEIVDGLPEVLEPLVSRRGSLTLRISNVDPSKLATVAKELDEMYRAAFAEEVLPVFYRKFVKDPEELLALEDNKKVYIVPTYTCTILKHGEDIYWVFHPNFFVKAGPYEAVEIYGSREQRDGVEFDKRLERARREAERILA